DFQDIIGTNEVRALNLFLRDSVTPRGTLRDSRLLFIGLPKRRTCRCKQERKQYAKIALFKNQGVIFPHGFRPPQHKSPAALTTHALAGAASEFLSLKLSFPAVVEPT